MTNLNASQQVFGTLAKWGRIQLRTLIQHSDLSAKQVYHGLTVLIQQHLVLHQTPAAVPSFYQVDWDGAYNLVRSGKIVSTVEARLGLKAASVLSSLLQLGHARVSDLEDAFRFDKGKSGQTSLPNGTHPTLDANDDDEFESGKISSKEELHNVLWQLLQARFIAKVHPRSYLSPEDKQNELEETVREEDFGGGKTSGPKAKLAFNNAVILRKRKWQDDEQDVSKSVQHRTKRPKTNGHTTNGTRTGGADGDEVTIAGDLVLRVNFDRCATAMRSDKLAQLAQRCLGETTSRVYEAFLHVVERQVATCRSTDQIKTADSDEAEDMDVYKATTMDVLEYLEQDPEALEGLGLDDKQTNGDQPRAKKARLDDNASYKSRNYTMQKLDEHLRLLGEHDLKFVERVSGRGSGEYAVPFNSLATTLRETETESVISSLFGTVAARMVRLLKLKGKLDEKQICTLALLKVKDVRTVLDGMHEAGLVESQEVPKDATRQPSRAVYLWSFDQHRAEHLVLDRSYTAMARCLQRIAVQRAQVQGVIDKAERTDVVGHEDEFLTKADKMHLRSWREQEEKLLAQVSRMDEGVAVLRDF